MTAPVNEAERAPAASANPRTFLYRRLAVAGVALVLVLAVVVAVNGLRPRGPELPGRRRRQSRGSVQDVRMNCSNMLGEGSPRTLGRHTEIDDVTARKYFDQFADEFGKGWWR